MLDKDEQAILLLTNRLLLDWFSISIDNGTLDRKFAEKLIDFSAKEVVTGAPWIEKEALQFAELFKGRLPNGTGG